MFCGFLDRGAGQQLANRLFLLLSWNIHCRPVQAPLRKLETLKAAFLERLISLHFFLKDLDVQASSSNVEILVGAINVGT